MKDVLIIGNKPCRNFPMGKIIDTFENNIRCNFVTPGYNNDGHLFDKLAMCNHEYHNYVKKDYDLEKILDIYTPKCDEKYIRETFSIFKENIPKYNEIYFAQWDVSKHNSFLRSVGCPHSIIGLPRTGFTVMMDCLIKKHSVFIVNFSLPHTEHEQFGFIEDRTISKQANILEVKKERDAVKKFEESGAGWSNVVHHTKNEVQIIKWLHDVEIIDASLCLIADTPNLNYDLGEMNLSNYMKQKIELLYNN